MKRKRKESCPSPILDDSPKRTKVQAQRKFAQNSGVNSPVLTPIRDLETADLLPHTNVLPEPVELLPMKRPNTEDFLTFLCFRGTPILPPNLQFFNTASIVADGQVHEIKGESPKNGPIDIAKCASGSSDKPFIAFGVRKRADPIVISRQMERKRRHALAIQALRRKYQEQKMAKIRALTISKLSEKTTNKTLVKTNTIQKTETVTKKTNTLQKTKVIATKHVKVTTQTLKTSLKPKIKPKMCLRSFRGKFVQRELPFKAKRSLSEKETDTKRSEVIKKVMRTSRNSNKPEKLNKKVLEPPVARKAPRPIRRIGEVRKTVQLSSNTRVTRSGVSTVVRNPKVTASVKRPQVKKRILLQATTAAVVKPTLRSTTLKKTVLSRRKAQQRIRASISKQKTEKIAKTPQETTVLISDTTSKPEIKKPDKESTKKAAENTKKNTSEEVKKPSQENLKKQQEIPKRVTRRDSEIALKVSSEKPSKKNEVKKEVTKNLELKKEIKIAETTAKKQVKKNVNLKREFNMKTNNKEVKKNIDMKKVSDIVLEKNENGQKIKRDTKVEFTLKKTVSKKAAEDKPPKTNPAEEKTADNPKQTRSTVPEEKPTENSKKSKTVLVEEKPTGIAKKSSNNPPKTKINIDQEKTPVAIVENIASTELPQTNVKKNIPLDKSKKKNPPKEETIANKVSEELSVKKTEKIKELVPVKKEEATIPKANSDECIIKRSSKEPLSIKKEETFKRKLPAKREETEQLIQRSSTRPTRKTKEAAAIYMEILSHKLVNESQNDDDNVSIDSFPELPNVKKTEQRENELKAQAKSSKDESKEKTCKEPLIIEDSKKILKGKKDIVEKVEVKEVKCESENPKIPEAIEELVSKGPIELVQKKVTEMSKSPLLGKKIAKVLAPPPDKNIGKNIKEEKNPKPSSENPKNHVADATEAKRKSLSPNTASDSESDNEVLQKKVKKPEGQKEALPQHLEVTKKVEQQQQNPPKPPPSQESLTKRQTRRSNQVRLSESNSSDESFHIDIKIPRKRKMTRSRSQGKSISVLEKNVDIILEAARELEAERGVENKGEVIKEEKKIDVVEIKEDKIKNEKKVVNELKPILKQENIPISLDPEPEVKIVEVRKAAQQKINEKPGDLSDSDESTTSDINLKSLQVKQRNKKLSKIKSSKSSTKTTHSFSDSDEEPLSKLTTKSIKSVTDTDESKKKPKTIRKTADKCLAEVSLIEPKPKRECTKRPSNYLPMLSSSEEDEEPYFHGFNTTKEALKKPKTFVQSLTPSLDLLSKDIGRKGKVNMSNEQIEQWLKDSALAGSGVAKENDAMLKFGERIPTEMISESIEASNNLDLKPSELDLLKAKQSEPLPSSSTVSSPDDKPKGDLKSPLGDRKWIFKKDKKDATPNKNAFSPENECSVYAFGEDNEDVICTPFRRPSRRPSSTTTSKSEDELSKNDETSKQGQFRKPSDSEDSRCFNIPQNPTKLSKIVKSESMVPPSTSFHSKRATKPSFEKFPEPFDDYKYKIPSSPSASSGSSAKLYKKPNQKQKGRSSENLTPVYVSDFPKPTDPAKLVEAPVFHPTEQEFQDPLEYIERIRHKAEQFGICKIVPPISFKPECKVSDDMRFTAYNQFVHKMLHRWGPNFKEFMAIRKYLATQNITLKTPPWIGGMEIDLPRLYQTVQSLGGLKEVIEKKKWSKVSDNMKIPKSAQDRVTKLDDIYCKYLLPYDTLSPAEREKLFDEVETYWAKKESKNLQMKIMKSESKFEETSDPDDEESDDNEAEECTVKGKNMALNAFYRIARNTMAMYFKVAEPTAQEVEQEFWRYVTQKQNHICVHSASIDCGNWGYGFPVSKNSPFARHPWNLKVLTNNSGSVLRSLGPVMGVTVPTLHVGMVFSACCWYRDPHGLPWIEYLHTGGNKIWYGIPSSSCEVFHAAIQKLVPNYCRDKELWLPSDTAMVPPGLLMEHNVSLCRTVQEPGQFIIVFPKVFTSSVSTGYVVSESVYFAPLYWLKTARNLFNDLKRSCEPSMFSLDKLLISISNDVRTSVEVLRVITPFIEELCTKERENRIKLKNFGNIQEEKLTNPETNSKKKKMHNVEGDFECEVCRINLFVSMVVDTQDDLIYCLEDAITLVNKNSQLIERLKLKYTFDEEELNNIISKVTSSIENKLQKKVPSKFSGLPTLLK